MLDALIAKGRMLEGKFQMLADKLNSNFGLGRVGDSQRETLGQLLNRHREISEVFGLMVTLAQAEDNHPQPCPVSPTGCPKCA